MDGAALSVAPAVCKTYARVGSRPTIRTNTWVTSRVYLYAGITEAGELYYTSNDKGFCSEDVINFLNDIKAKNSKKLLVIWDNAAVHHSKATKAFCAENDILSYYIPPYSPEFNPTEQVWRCLKWYRLGSQIFKNREELRSLAIETMEQIKQEKELISKFFHHPKVCYLGTHKTDDAHLYYLNKPD